MLRDDVLLLLTEAEGYLSGEEMREKLGVSRAAVSQAVRALRADGRYTEEELAGAKKVLTAAALTYLAALAGSILQLIRLMLIAGSRSNRNSRD